jgi:hypothetical protein
MFAVFLIVFFVCSVCSISLLVSLAAKRRPALVNVRAPPLARDVTSRERV